jgi:hypothetical protein
MDHKASRAVTFLAAVAVMVAASPASAFDLRSPQVVFDSAPLTALLRSLGLTGIDPSTSQLDAQVWSTASWPSRDMTMLLKSDSPGTTIGLYDALGTTTTLYPVLPSSLAAGWFCACHFSSAGTLIVSLFDHNAVFQGRTTFSFPAGKGFGFYVQNSNGTFYSQDERNGGLAQMLTFADQGFAYDWYLCFQGSAATTGSTFTDAVVEAQVIVVVPARTQSWGAIKARFR